eukprot:6404518-Amphidinium_carterae.1
MITSRSVQFGFSGFASRFIPALKGLGQGRSESPYLFQFYVGRVFAHLATAWNLEDSHKWQILALLFYMDDGLVFAGSQAQLQLRVQAVAACGRQAGLCLNPAKCRFYANTGQRHQSLDVDADQIQYAGDSFAFLGSWFAMKETNSHTAVQHRIQQSSKALWAWAPLLRNKLSPLSSRLRLLDLILPASALWGAHCWTSTALSQQALSVHYTTWIARCLAAPRQAFEPWLEYTRRTRHAAKLLQADRLSLHTRWATSALGWAGHVA